MKALDTSAWLASLSTWGRHLFYLDLYRLALFRIALGCVTGWDLLHRAQAFQAHYGADGVLPTDAISGFSDILALLPLYQWMPGTIAGYMLFGIHGLACLCLICGIRTRWACLICWLLLNALHARNPIVLYGADRELAALLLWACFLPLGAKWSLDGRQRLSWAGRTQVHGWACAGLILQVGLIYLTSVFSKSGESWSHGQAVWWAVHLDAYTSEWGRRLIAHPEICRLLTYATLMVEGMAPLMLLTGTWKPLRRIGCLLLIGMQMGFFILLDVGMFPWVSIIGLVALLPGRRGMPPNASRSPMVPLEALAAILVILMLSWQIALVRVDFSINALLGRMPSSLGNVLRVTRLAQSWSMFSPDPPSQDG